MKVLDLDLIHKGTDQKDAASAGLQKVFLGRRVRNITITDQGRGLRDSDIPDPTAEENLLKTSGRGIFLIRSFMDEVKIKDLHPGTEITLVKHVTPVTEKKES